MKEPSCTTEMMEKFRKQLSVSATLEERIKTTAAHLQEVLLCNFLTLQVVAEDGQIISHVAGSPRANKLALSYPLSIHEGELWYQDERITLPHYGVPLPHESSKHNYAAIVDNQGLHSVAIVALYKNGKIVGFVQCGFLGKHHHWRVEERFFLQQTAQQLEQVLFSKQIDTNCDPAEQASITKNKHLKVKDSEIERLLGYGQLVLIRTDPEFIIKEVFGSTEKLFGLKSEQLVGKADIWDKIFNQRDMRRIALRIKRMGNTPQEFGEEIRYSKYNEHEPRWMLLKAISVVDKSGKLIGWEGFGFDITERRLVEIQLRAQRERTEALYEVSRALRINQDPAVVTLRGLNALIHATGSDAGFCCFFDESTKAVEMVAAEGLSQKYLEGIQSVVDGRSLVRLAIEQRQGILVENIQEDTRAAQDMARLEDLKATILMPLLSGKRILGALVIFSREAKRYTAEDFQLVSAAASQISFAARQAEFYAAEKQESETLSVLYRLTHEISRLFTPQEIGEHLFSVLQQEFSCKRLWFGVLNNQGTHIAGCAGYGPGIRRQLKEVQIELGLRHDFLDQAIRTKRPVIVAAGSSMECSGLNRLIGRLNVGTFVILPLLSLGQIAGVLVAEPVISSTEYIEKKLSLLSRMMTEVGAVLMARRFEERVAESDKMRVATVLASGVAHNFNNLLQAVMGQASLIQMQAEEDSPVQELARTIIESAGKGASLVKHLLSFSAPSDSLKERFSMSRFLSESKDLYTSLLGVEISFELSVPDYPLEVLGDSSLLQQALTNILINAKEAIGTGGIGGRVQVSAKRVRLASGEIDPSLPPGTYIRLDIEDNGSGMDEERLQRCFEPFYSSKNQDATTGLSLSGSGLGLSSAYSLIRQHGGILTARSTPGLGTTFSCFLPQYEPKVAEVKELFTMPEASRSMAVLVQSQGSAGISIRRMFEEFGLQVKIAPDIETANLITHSPQYTVRMILLDADYLGKSTISFVSELIEKSISNLHIVVATVSRQEWEPALEEFQGVRVVEKPISIRGLQTIMRQLFQDPAGAAQSKENSRLRGQIERSKYGKYIENGKSHKLEVEEVGKAKSRITYND